MKSFESSVERTDGVVLTEPVLTEQEKQVEEPEKWTRLVMTANLLQSSQKTGKFPCKF